MKRRHYAWIICIACTVLQFCNIGLIGNAFSVYLPYLNSVLGLTKTQASTTTTIRCLFALFGMLLVHPYLKKLGFRRGVSLASLLGALAYVLYSLAKSYPLVCVAAALSGFAYAFGGMLPVCVLIRNWFYTHDALALGLCMAGSGVASMLAPPLLTACITNHSLSAAFFSEALLMFLCAVVVYILVRAEPKEMGLSPFGAEGTDPKAPMVHAPGMKLTKPEYALIILCCVLLGPISNTGFSHLSVLYTDAGINSLTIASLLSLQGFVFTVSKCLCGGIIDRIGTYRANYLFYIPILIGYGIACFAYEFSLPVIYLGNILLGMGFPISAVGSSTMARDFSDDKSYDAFITMVNITYMLGSIFTGFMPGMIADLTGSYRPAYWIFFGMSLFIFLSLQVIYHRNLKKRNAANA